MTPPNWVGHNTCPDAREFALSRRVLLARTREDAVDVDIALGALPFEERSVGRASAWHLRDDVFLTTCSAEDLVIHKAFAGRDLDWSDVEEVLIRQRGKLDLNLIAWTWSILRSAAQKLESRP